MKYLICLEHDDVEEDEQRPRRMFVTAEVARQWVREQRDVYVATLYVLTSAGTFRVLDVFVDGFWHKADVELRKAYEQEMSRRREQLRQDEGLRRSMPPWWMQLLGSLPPTELMSAMIAGGAATGKKPDDDNEWPEVIGET